MSRGGGAPSSEIVGRRSGGCTTLSTFTRPRIAPKRGCAGDDAVVSSRSTARQNAVAVRRISEPVEQLRRHQLRAPDAAAVAPIELHRRLENQVALHVA